MTRSATCLAKPISCVTTIIVTPDFARSFMTSRTSPTTSGSSDDVGSSNNITRGFMANARARKVTISLDGKPFGVVELAENQRGYVRIPIGGVKVEMVRFTIDSVWPGKKWQDVAISEIRIIGQ